MTRIQALTSARKILLTPGTFKQDSIFNKATTASVQKAENGDIALLAALRASISKKQNVADWTFSDIYKAVRKVYTPA